MPASVISSQSMRLGVLASASHAIKTNSIFLVYYRPRSSQSQYIVSLNKYLQSSKIGFTDGMRFKMSFEGDDVPVKKFSGTIVDKGDLAPQWKGSEWKTLKVQWDDAANFSGPERVSCWEIEPFDASAPSINIPMQPSTKTKRSRETAESLDVQELEPAQEFWLSGSGRAQQQEKTGTGSCEPNCISGRQVVWTSERPGYGGTTSSSSVCQNTVVPESWLKDFNSSSKGVSPTLSEIYQKLFRIASTEARVAPWPGFSAYQAEEPSSKLSCNTALCSYRTDEVTPDFTNAVEEKKEPVLLRLFGVDMINHIKNAASTDNIPIGAGEKLTRADCSYEDSGRLSAFSKVTKDHTQFVSESPREIQSHQSSTARTQIKVQMHGNAVGRSVDLANFDRYEQLIGELEHMFEIKELNSKEKWKVAFTDDDGATIEIEDNRPWLEFRQVVKKIVIYPIEDWRKVEPGPEEEDLKTEF